MNGEQKWWFESHVHNRHNLNFENSYDGANDDITIEIIVGIIVIKSNGATVIDPEMMMSMFPISELCCSADINIEQMLISKIV